jgi:hypothetical protein
VIGVFAVVHMTLHVPCWADYLGTVVFLLCSHAPLQGALKALARRCLEWDWAEDLEAELIHGLMVAVDFGVCATVVIRSYLGDEPLALVLSYCNALVAFMEFRVCVWQEIRAKQRRLSSPDLRRATKEELRSHNDVCAVCLEPMSAARVTHCRHLFHGKCLRQALGVSPQCPVCKKSVAYNGQT